MLAKMFSNLDNAERKLRYSFGTDITDPKERRKSLLHYHLFDHAFLRAIWTNFYPVSEGVWRSNQPTFKRFAKYRDMGIKSVINLRGPDPRAQYLFEEEACRLLGLKLHNAKLWARTAADRENIVAVIDLMRSVERPFLFHCKSGADRAGFCAAMYQIIFDGVPVEQAKEQLSLKYIHLKWGKTGVQSYILDVYEARRRKTGVDFETWIRTEYDNDAIQAGFDAKTPPEQLGQA